MRNHLQSFYIRASDGNYHHYTFDEGTKTVVQIGQLTGVDQLACLEQTPDGFTLSALRENEQNKIVCLGQDEQVLSRSIVPELPCQMLYDNLRRLLYILTAKTISAYTLSTDGQLQNVAQQQLPDGTRPSFISCTPDALIVVGDDGKHRLHIYDFIGDSLELINTFDLPEDSSPIQLICHRQSKMAYVLGRYGIIDTLFYDGYGVFEAYQRLNSSTAGTAISMAATDDYLYVAHDEHSHLTGFKILADGSLLPLDQILPITHAPKTMFLTVSGSCLILTDPDKHHISNFAIDPETGQLKACQQLTL